MCDGRNHNLKIIFSTREDDMIEHVVRWCADCGAVVVDVDLDGRTKPGNMVFPASTLHKRNSGAGCAG